MGRRIEDYALIGDRHTCALVSREGSIDWLAFPRFDSAACCAALVGDVSNGCWGLAPCDPVRKTARRYRGDTLILETAMITERGEVRVTDFMPLASRRSSVVRIVQGVRGSVEMRCRLQARFDYGLLKPWLRFEDRRVVMVAGPHGLALYGDAPVRCDGERGDVTAEFTVREGESVAFQLVGFPSYEEPPGRGTPRSSLEETVRRWEEWSSRCTYRGEWRDAVLRSLITLQALTYAPTGGLIAAPTTSLPEQLGGVRNWDYRYCWLRDATFTVLALGNGGYYDEAGAFRDWLLRAVAGDPSKMQILYGIAGERRADEWIADWLCGYEGATPVRVGNDASTQFQLDVYGELLDAMYQAHRHGMQLDETAWNLLRAIADYVVENWTRKDHGIWEARGAPRHYTQSQVMAWAALDRTCRLIDEFGYAGSIERYRRVRDEIHALVLERGYDFENRTFTRAFGTNDLDASSLLMSHVGFLPAEDERIRGTVAAIERELADGPFVYRYSSSSSPQLDGLPSGEGAFLACSFWLADNYVLLGREDDARRLMEEMLALRNDVGLLSEEYDTHRKRLVGNFPQALSHLALVNTAFNISAHHGPVHQRSGQHDRTEARVR